MTHIEVDKLMFTVKIAAKEIDARYVPTEEQAANISTNLLHFLYFLRGKLTVDKSRFV
ncbi:hypothetical protein L484_012461 [Morus notabilis]|uniref:Uncharacterized protein n=1 Tax=Morus notabilis TaxID=981085 RepID=W9R0Z7_9ROSA|nr:hypothetical protein L484_012461 [Morus notabilis]